jgi:pyruvate/2-oxoglutarate dehydrogenase complex dihydrolipoamide acyltransferase (E2) component
MIELRFKYRCGMQIIPKVRSFGEDFGRAVGGGAGQGLSQALQERQQLKDLAAENAQILKETGVDLSGIKNPEARKMAFVEAMKEKKPLNDLQKSQKALADARANELKSKGDQLAADKRAMYAFGDKLQTDNPDNPLYKTIGDIYKSDLPPDQASNMVKAITGSDPFKAQQQRRLQMDSILNRYSKRLKEIDDEIKSVRNPNSTGLNEITDLKKQRNALRRERDQILDFKSLNGLEDDEEESFEDEEDEDEFEPIGAKVTFDPKNKGHKATAEKLYKKYGNKEKVREILRKNFKGL